MTCSRVKSVPTNGIKRQPSSSSSSSSFSRHECSLQSCLSPSLSSLQQMLSSNDDDSTLVTRKKCPRMINQIYFTTNFQSLPRWILLISTIILITSTISNNVAAHTLASNPYSRGKFTNHFTKWTHFERYLLQVVPMDIKSLKYYQVTRFHHQRILLLLFL